ncbi:MAG: FtsX-like permease family protein [Ardenticatenaceae bacterium]|nr:FtsX-like permease family protein [Ardenticatenaceae bacterium]
MVNQFLSLLSLASRRLWNQRLLMACLLVGLVAAVSILSAVPLYADATQNRLLQGELTEAGTFRPPFAFMWRYIGAWNGDITAEDYRPVDTYLSEQAARVIGLPADQVIRHVSTLKLRLFSGRQTGFASGEPLLWANVGFLSGLEDHVRFVEGTAPGEADSGGELPVVVSQATADRLGLQVGEDYTLFGSGEDGGQIPMVIVGVWTPIDPTDPYWFYTPETFNDILLSSESAFFAAAAPQLDLPISTAVWYLILDGRTIRPGNVNRLLSDINTAEARVNALLPSTTLEVSPVSALSDFGDTAGLLTLTLTLFSLPVIGLVLYFVSLMAGMVVRRGRSEIAIMRSRGISKRQVLAIYIIEGVLLAIIGLSLGLLVGRWVAALMGRTRSFLVADIFGTEAYEGIVAVLTPTAIGYALLGVMLTLAALFWPAWRNAGHTIVTLRNLQARDLLKPSWQRYYVDILLLALPLYGWYQLDRQGTLAILNSGSDPFSNPLLFLVPILFCFALGLVAIRFFPRVMGIFAWLADRQPSTTLLIILRQLARAAGQYTGPLLLLTLTLALATFTSSMALTLDDHLVDQMYYKVGADLAVVELGEATERPQQPTAPGQPQRPQDDEENEDEPDYLFLPVDTHLEIPGVERVTRVGNYDVVSAIGGRQRRGSIVGVDRLDFTHIAFFRRDFASNESLGGVMNRLAVGREYILIERNFMSSNGLQVGDPLQLTVQAGDVSAEVDFVIAAPLDYFPSLYPQDGPFFVAHLDYLHEGLGGVYPYDVWMETDPAVDSETIVQGVRELGITVIDQADARLEILEAQTRPERQGLFGLLSVGFGSAAIVTVLGFLVFAIVSFQQRYIELGMMRAVGLSIRQMAAYLAGEQAALIVSGTALGTILGVVASVVFIPFFQVGTDKSALVPPYEVQIAWQQIGLIYTVFGIMFVLAVAVLIGLLTRMKLFEAVKLGETV